MTVWVLWGIVIGLLVSVLITEDRVKDLRQRLTQLEQQVQRLERK